jgi:quinol monooxygenase YgiN
MSRIGIVVEFTPKPDCHAAFDTLIREHARATLAEEPGCQRFDVLQPIGTDGKSDTGKIMLVEVYENMAAFDAHRANPRLPRVAAAYAPLLDGRKLTICAMD